MKENKDITVLVVDTVEKLKDTIVTNLEIKDFIIHSSSLDGLEIIKNH